MWTSRSVRKSAYALLSLCGVSTTLCKQTSTLGFNDIYYLLHATEIPADAATEIKITAKVEIGGDDANFIIIPWVPSHDILCINDFRFEAGGILFARFVFSFVHFLPISFCIFKVLLLPLRKVPRLRISAEWRKNANNRKGLRSVIFKYRDLLYYALQVWWSFVS